MPTFSITLHTQSRMRSVFALAALAALPAAVLSNREWSFGVVRLNRVDRAIDASLIRSAGC